VTQDYTNNSPRHVRNTLSEQRIRVCKYGWWNLWTAGRRAENFVAAATKFWRGSCGDVATKFGGSEPKVPSTAARIYSRIASRSVYFPRNWQGYAPGP
jgi:hypothetical protein